MPEELDASRVKGILDSAVNVELQRHVLHPGGNVAGDIRLWCDQCRMALIPENVLAHLERAAMRAITPGSH